MLEADPRPEDMASSVSSSPPPTGAPRESPAGAEPHQVPVQAPRFTELQPALAGDGAALDRFYDVSVTVSAELGRVSMSLGELLKMGDGSVVKLDRPVTAPVELMAQGVRVAWGEVVVVDDCFAVRVKEIERTRKGA